MAKTAFSHASSTASPAIASRQANATPGTNARVDGYEIRTAAVAEGIPCITTVQGLAAAVQGIEALIEGSVGVTPLQEWATRYAVEAR